jgi:HlyD family secretion protein
LALLVAIAWSFWPSPHGNVDMVPIDVQSGLLAESVPINAVLVPSRIAVVSTLSGGLVTEVVATAGQSVKAGEPLLKLSNADLERQLAEAASELAGAQADFISQQVDSRDQTDARQVDLAKAESQLRIAQMQFEAEKKLQEQGIISALALKRTEAERDGKIAEHEYARRRAAQAGPAGAAKLKASSERTAVLRARFDSLRAAVDALVLRAPFDGLVAKIDGKPGATFVSGASVAEVIAPKMELTFDVAEHYANSVHAGQALRFRNGLAGTVTSIAPIADGGVVEGRASVTGDTRTYRSNTSLIGEAILKEHGAGLFVQAEGLDIADRTLSAQVQTLAGEIEERVLKFGPRYGQKVALLSGAAADERIVGLILEK